MFQLALESGTHLTMRGIQMKSKQIVGVALALTLVLVLAGAGCQRRVIDNEITNNTIDNTIGNTANNTVGNTINNTISPVSGVPDSGLPNPTLIIESLKKETKDATDRIRTLKADAQLTIVSSKYINSLSDFYGLNTNWYIFASASDPANFYLVNMPRNGESLKRLIMPKVDFSLGFDVLPIPMGPTDNKWLKSYADALQIAETNGGSAFRAQHKTFETSVILAYPAGQPQLNWYVTYKATDGTAAYLKAQIDATTGNITIVQ
ncbi:MAG: hypothetical protein WC805_01940 [Patescibacteria group bacterium]|jgi:hypothetical protein